MKLGMHVGLGPGHIMLGGDSAPPPLKEHSRDTPPIFGPYLAQMAAWIKMSLGIVLCLGPGDFVLDGDPASLHQKGAEPPNLSAHVYCGQTAGWMKLILGGGRH